MTDKEAMAMALEALEYIDDGANNQGAHTGISWRCVSNKAQPAIASLHQAIAEAEKQEPYAYTYLGIKNDGSQHGPHLCWKPEYMDVMSHSKGAIAVPLYTTPPQRTWVGLTDEDIGDAYVAWDDTNGASFADFARAIEAKLKQKNGYAEENT